MAKFNFRAEMIEKMLELGWGCSTPSPESVASMRSYYNNMTDEQIFEEYTSDIWKDGQDSMSGY